MIIVKEEKEMEIEINMEEATALSREIEKALASIIDKKGYPLILTALEILQIELVMSGMNETVQEELNKDRVGREELAELIKEIISALLLDVTTKTLSITEFILIPRKELH